MQWPELKAPGVDTDLKVKAPFPRDGTPDTGSRAETV